MNTSFFEAVFGPIEVRKAHRKAMKHARSWHAIFSDLDKRLQSEPVPAGEQPVFIFGAGWRCGSTLLQRMFLGGHDVMIWGEPYAHANLIENLMEQFKPLSHDYPPDSYFFVDADQQLKDEWTANLYPRIDDLRRAHLAFFDSLFAAPARALGWQRWGFKEVRLGSRHARYLRWLYPSAHFLWLYRDPYDAYRSYRRWRDWYWRWPEKPIMTPTSFGRLWFQQTNDFLANCEELNADVLSFDELTYPAVAKSIAEKTQADVVPSSFLSRQAGILPIEPPPVPRFEQFLLRRVVEPLAKELRQCTSDRSLINKLERKKD